MWEVTSGILPPISPIIPKTYKKSKLPWFDIYSEAPATGQAGHFQNVQSIADIDKIVKSSASTLIPGRTTLHELLDPDQPPTCSKCSEHFAACVFRPCNHVACERCLFVTQEDSERCSICSLAVERFVGFRTPVQSRKVAELEAIDREEDIVGVTVQQASEGTVRTIILDEDRVNGLRGGRIG